MIALLKKETNSFHFFPSQKMESLPEPLILEILTRLNNNDSTESTRSRLTSKTFNSAYPHLKSINLQYPLTHYLKSRSIDNPQPVTPFKEIFTKMVENLLSVESVCIGVDRRMRDVSFDEGGDVEGKGDGDDLWLSDDGWVGMWLGRVCGGLRRLSISDFWVQSCWRRSSLLALLSGSCHNLVELEVKNAWLSVENLNPMPMLTSLTLEFIRLDDEDLNELNRCFPNLQVLNLIGVGGFKLPKIHLLNLKTCHWTVSNVPSSLALITPNLITLRLECIRPTSLYVDAPMLSNFHLSLDQPEAFTTKKFQNLKTLWLESLYIGSLLFKFPITETVENLTLDSRNWAKGAFKSSQFTLEKVFAVFPNVNTLCINSSAWSELESCSDPEGWAMTTGRKGLKTFSAYLLLVDPSLTFSSVACLLDQCVGLSEVSLLIHHDVVANVSKSFISKCVARWPKVKWRWGMWKEGKENSWIMDDDVNC